ncbi:MAG: zinc ribbon domain-containing protein [Haliea sp.]|uniref:Zn-ribbon domain-containing OB-fold protein n=1 Tax=Haliea sp. TaxID=1932666 RepID=UPI0032EB2A3F
MSTTPTMRSRLKQNRPSLRKLARPPKQRTALGSAFNAANLPVALALQHCRDCGTVQYPPRELCRQCLGDALVWRSTSGSGRLVSSIELHHSLWEYFKRRLVEKPWPVASVRLDCGVIVFAHLATETFGDPALPAGTAVQVFTHTDCSLNAVMIAVAADIPVDSRSQRHAITASLGLLEPAIKPEGI